MAKKVLTYNVSESLDGAVSASFDIHTGTGNLTIDALRGVEQLLACGTIEYMEGQDPPTPSVNKRDGQASFALRAEGGRQAFFRLPWSAFNGATHWKIHLNPRVACDIRAHSGGGNVKLDLAAMVVTRVCADSGGGNLEVVLPENAARLDVAARSGGGKVVVEIASGTTGSGTVEARSGAGNVTVRLPSSLPARIHAITGMGKAIIDPRFTKLEAGTYQSPDYDGATDKVEISIKSGAGNVSVNIK